MNNILLVNTRRLRRLKDLQEYKIDDFLLNSLVTNYHPHDVANSISHIKYQLHNNDHCGSMKSIHKLLSRIENKFSIDLYYDILKLPNLPINIATIVTKNLQNISNMMMNLHLEDCVIVKTNPNCSYSRYFQARQKVYNESQHECCLLCIRGSILFNTIIDVSQRLHVHRLSLDHDCNYDDCDNCDYNYSYNTMRNFYMNEMKFRTMKQFKYCPFHMENNYNINQMIVRHTSCPYYNINHLRLKRMYHVTLSIVQDMIKLGAIALKKRYFMQALEIGKVILNVSTQLLSLAIIPIVESNDTSFVVIPSPHTEFVQTIEKISSWKIFLTVFFQLLIDLNKHDLAMSFHKQHEKFISYVRTQNTYLNTVDINSFRKSFDFLIDQCPPLYSSIDEYIQAAKHFMQHFDAYQYMILKCAAHGRFDEISIKDFDSSQYPDLDSILRSFKSRFSMFDRMLPNKNYPIMILERSRLHTSLIDDQNVVGNTTSSQHREWKEWIHNVDRRNADIFGPDVYDRDHEKATKEFDGIFLKMEQDIKLYDMNKWEDTVQANFKCFPCFLWYANFLYQIKSKQACKYFEYCLQLRPLNGYLNFLYSIHLYKVMKNYRLSYFHLKMTHKLNPNIYILNQMGDKAKFFENEKISSQITLYQGIIRLLCVKLDKHHKCDWNECNKILTKLNACSGCKCVFYCSRKCQKRDWKQHKIKCISTFTHTFDKQDKQTLQQMTLFLNQSLKNYVSKMSCKRLYV